MSDSEQKRREQEGTAENAERSGKRGGEGMNGSRSSGRSES